MGYFKKLFNLLFVYTTSSWFVQLFRYTFVGGFAFIVDYVLLYVCTEFAGIHYLLSATISFIAGLIINYAISTKWIFTNSKISNTLIEFTIYGVVGIIGLVLNDILLYIFTDYIGIHYMISKLVTAIIVMGWNFIARRAILFKN